MDFTAFMDEPERRTIRVGNLLCVEGTVSGSAAAPTEDRIRKIHEIRGPSAFVSKIPWICYL